MQVPLLVDDFLRRSAQLYPEKIAIVDGDLRIGIRSLPAQLGPDRAARLACVVMTIPQLVVIASLWSWGHSYTAAAISVSVILQFVAMRRMLKDPLGLAPWYNGTGIMLYVSGMMLSALLKSNYAILYFFCAVSKTPLML